MRIGTIMPPPVHAMIILINLYENGAVGPIFLNTLQPFSVQIHRGGLVSWRKEIQDPKICALCALDTNRNETITYRAKKCIQAWPCISEKLKCELRSYQHWPRYNGPDEQALTISDVCINTNSANPLSRIQAVGSSGGASTLAAFPRAIVAIKGLYSLVLPEIWNSKGASQLTSHRLQDMMELACNNRCGIWKRRVTTDDTVDIWLVKAHSVESKVRNH